MRAQELIREGNIKEALSSLTDSIRNDPANIDYRIFLFQLLAVDGQYERALNQLNVAGEMDAKTLLMVQTYREVMKCEALRKDVFDGKRTPLIFGEPQAWVAPILEALKLSAVGEHVKSQQLRSDAYALIPKLSGDINGEIFEWVADADSRIGPFIEAMINGKYFWVPMTCIKTMKLNKPEDLRDLLWLPVEFTWANDGDAMGFVPVRYINDEGNDNPMIKLSRLTQWLQLGNEIYYGMGQRLFATDQADYPMLEVREINFRLAAK